MAYTKKVWKDAPDTSTPINAANLNHMEDGIAEANVNAQNALDRLDDVDDEITQINSDLSWYATSITKNGSQSTLTGQVEHNSAIHLTKLDIRWTNPTSDSGTDLLVFTFNNNYPSYPFLCSAVVGTTPTHAYYNSEDHGMYIYLPGGQYPANNEVRISGILGY